MWLIANGAPKSGSTWVYNLLAKTDKCSRIPEQYQEKKWQNSSVSETTIKEAHEYFVDSPELYLSKQHWADHADLVFSNDNVKIFNIIRDLRDATVSFYYHRKREIENYVDIDEYLENEGKIFIEKYINYQKYWAEKSQNKSGQYYITSYEYMLEHSFEAGIDVMEFANIPLTISEREKVVEENLFKNNKNKGPGEFYRKGKALAFSDDLNEQQVDAILEIAETNEYITAKRMISEFNPSLKEYLEMTDVGV